MKIAKITDLHFGARNNNPKFDDYFKKFYLEQFFPYIEEHSIKHIICLGDTFDIRKNINYEILDSCKAYFFDKIPKDVHVTFLVGNHDAYYKNTIKINALKVLMSKYDNITIIDEPTEYHIGRHKLLMIPWICDENQEESFKLISSSDAKYCYGHLEVAGFKMYKHTESLKGLSPLIFNRFKKVFSGHYHTRSTSGNITYLGTPYEIDWNDYNDPRGFHIFDLETGDLEFIENPLKMFVIHKYNEESSSIPDFKDQIVKIETSGVVDKVKFDKFIKTVESANPVDLKITDRSLYKVADTTSITAIDDTRTLINEYVDAQETEDLSKDTLKTILNKFYLQASTL